MQTAFTDRQLADPQTAASHAEIRKCVHCGFCTATCPTYVLLGDERDSPRGRIELIKAMLEDGGSPQKSTVTHIDRCLSCLACVSACPSGVDYAQLIEQGRTHIEAHFHRPLAQRIFRSLLGAVLPRPDRLGVALALGRLARPLEPLLKSLKLSGLAALLRLVPAPVCAPDPQTHYPAEGCVRGRVALLKGCVEPAMSPTIRAAAIRLITRAGFDVELVEGEVCCGALSEHLGRADEAQAFAIANVKAWAQAGPFDFIVTTAAGCGTSLKAYGHRLNGTPEAIGAAQSSRDILEFIAEVGLPAVVRPAGLSVAYHAPCSLQHGQKLAAGLANLLVEAGFEVRPIAEGHLCCGSAGVYNILQPQLAGRLRDRKAAHIMRTRAQVVAAGNVGCIAQLSPAIDIPILHPVELLDWATGGPKPHGLPQMGA